MDIPSVSRFAGYVMDLAPAYRAKSKIKMDEFESENGYNDLNTPSIVIIKLPVMCIVARSLFLVMVIITVPFILSIARDPSNDIYNSDIELEPFGFESLPLLFQDLADEGLLKRGDKGLIVSARVGDFAGNLEFLSQNDIDYVVESDLDGQSSVPNEMFDFVFASSFGDNTGFIDRVVKVDGIVVLQLSNNPSDEFQKHPNYKIVYLRRFDSTFVAMKKIDLAVDGYLNFPIKRRLFGFTTEAKSRALASLEDVFLEPPRKKMAKLRKIKFLPDLLGDSLESYRRRIFITDEKNEALKWFDENYPTRSKDFEIYNLEIEMYDLGRLSKMEAPPVIDVSDWLVKNVKEEDYVVMKAEAQVVEEMMKRTTVNLVDELFLECKNQWEDDVSLRENTSKRAYWQCLALYGRLRDEGIAVHQWWS